MLRTVGVLEAQKQGIMVQLADNNKALDAIKKELEDEYGPINIDLATGEYTIVEPEEKK